MSVQLIRHRFTCDDYHAMAAAGALKEVDLVRDEVQLHREPTPGAFAFVERHGRGARVEPIAFPGLSLSVDELLG